MGNTRTGIDFYISFLALSLMPFIKLNPGTLRPPVWREERGGSRRIVDDSREIASFKTVRVRTEEERIIIICLKGNVRMNLKNILRNSNTRFEVSPGLCVYADFLYVRSV